MKFVKKKKIPRPKEPTAEKHLTQKAVRRLFLLVVSGLIVSGPLAWVKISETQVQIRQEQQNLTHEIQTATKKQFQNSQLTSELYKQFLAPFIETYINVPMDQEAFEQRQTSLQTTYFNFESEEEKNTGTERRLVSSEFYNFTTIEGKFVAVYRVHYALNVPVVKERTVPTDKPNETKVEQYTDYEVQDKTVLLNVPFQTNTDGTYKISSYPYFTNEQPLTTDKKTKNDSELSKLAPVAAAKEKQVTNFVKEFLTAYVSTTKEEMVYRMQEPEVLAGNYQLGEPTIQVFKKDQQLVALVQVDLLDQDTKAFHRETMTLFLKERDNTFYIEKLLHFLGGF